MHLGLLSCIEPGSRVLVPGFSFFASASAVVHAGGVPVFVDVDPETFLLDLDDAWEKTGEGTGAVVPVHLFGNVVPYDGLMELAEEYDLRIVHDAAQALGSSYMGAELGELVGQLKADTDVDQRWVSIGATDLQKGLMALTRAVAKPTFF